MDRQGWYQKERKIERLSDYRHQLNSKKWKYDKASDEKQ